MLFQDIRYSLRQLRKSPTFTLTVIVTLALGIGANTAIFTLFDQVLLRMLPVEQPSELVRLQFKGSFSGSASSFGGDMGNYFSYPMYKDLRDQNQVFAGVFAADRTQVGVSWHNQAENVDGEVVTGNYFQVLGLRPALGRLLTPQDDTAKDANPVAVLSYGYWKTHMAAAQDVVGQSILIDGHAFTILGVAPENFDSAIGGYKPSVFVPLSMVEVVMPWRKPQESLTNHQVIWLTIVARLKPNFTRDQAAANLGPLWHSLRANEIRLYKNPSERFRQGFVEKSSLLVLDDSKGFNPSRADLQKPLTILMCMAGLLVVLCAINVATLLLLRAAGRAREMSMRYALGARRRRIASQLFIEGGLLGLCGTAVGLACAPMVAAMLVRLITHSSPGEEPYSASIDLRVLLFTTAIAFATSFLFSIAPVFHFLRPDLANSLRQSSGTQSKKSQLFRKVAVGTQIILSVLLLGGAGLFVRTFDNLRHQDVGFDTGNVAMFSLDPTMSGYGEDRAAQIVTGALDAVRSIPGVISVAATNDPELMGDNETSNFSIQGYKSGEDEDMNFEQPRITPGYFATLHQPLLVGREFTEADRIGQTNVAVVNLALATRFFGTPQNAIGKSIAEGGGNGVKYDTTIVGVVGNSRHTDLRTQLGAAVYLPYFQSKHPGGVAVYVKTAPAPEVMETGIRQAIHQLDSRLVVDGLRTMDEQVGSIAGDERALAILAVGFSGLSMVLAAVGLYGVLAYSIGQRTREIGVRLALGSQRSAVVVLVVREMAVIAAVGTVIALPLVVTLARLFTSQLYGVKAFDPLTLAAAVMVTGVMVAAAAAIPARRAATVEPIQALRTE